MKLLIFSSIVILAFNIACAEASELSSCRQLQTIKLEMDLISRNIQNINITHSESGGHYVPKWLRCEQENCRIISDETDLFRYDPNHEDANTEGYVPSPNIDLMEEMGRMIEASHRWDLAREQCGWKNSGLYDE